MLVHLVSPALINGTSLLVQSEVVLEQMSPAVLLSAFSNGINTAYSKVCGRIIGEGAGSPDAFHRFISNQNTIEGN